MPAYSSEQYKRIAYEAIGAIKFAHKIITADFEGRQRSYNDLENCWQYLNGLLETTDLTGSLLQSSLDEIMEKITGDQCDA